MKKNRVLVLAVGLLAVVLLVAACGSETPTATPVPPAPTIAALPTDTAAPVAPTALPVTPEALPATPVAQQDDTLQRVQSSGHMVVGTSADYPPFESYNADFQLDGFDIALMNEIAGRLGVTADYHDIAFQGLGGAIQSGQVDLAIAAISVSAEREQVIDFTNVYYISEDGILAREDASIAAVASPVDLTGWRVGVERGSIFEGWIEGTLVATGQMPQTNLFSYEKAGDATRDLREQRLDLVVMDLLPAEAALAGGQLKLVGQGLNQERFAIALPKGEDSLRDEVNRILTDLQNEGMIAQLAQKYLDIDPAALVPLPPASAPTPTPQPAAPTPTPQADAPAPTQAPAAQPACQDAMVFVQHLNYDDRGMSAPPQFNPGAQFTKGWRVQNNGTCTWNTGYQLVFAHGNVPQAKMGGSPLKLTRQVRPGESYDVQLNLVAPLKAGTYQGLWQMQNGKGQAFGERLPIGVQVVALPAPTPQPTQPPAAGINLSVDRTNIRHGECVNFSWRVDNVKEVYFYREGKRWENHGVAGEGRQEECPPHTQTYSLRVVKRDDSVDTRQITINVEEPPAQADAPTIKRFTVEPSTVNLGECVDIRWNVEGNIDKITVWFEGTALWEGAPVKGNTQHCLEGAGPATYSLEATAIGGATSRSQQTITVVAPEQPVPQPTEVPEFPDPPTIDGFGVSPMEIVLGECVTINWATGGGTSYVRILRNGSVILDGAGFSGQEMDCPAPAGIYDYQLEAYNPYEVVVVSQSRVTVTEVSSQTVIDPTDEPVETDTVTITETVEYP